MQALLRLLAQAKSQSAAEGSEGGAVESGRLVTAADRTPIADVAGAAAAIAAAARLSSASSAEQKQEALRAAAEAMSAGLTARTAFFNAGGVEVMIDALSDDAVAAPPPAGGLREALVRSVISGSGREEDDVASAFLRSVQARGSDSLRAAAGLLCTASGSGGGAVLSAHCRNGAASAPSTLFPLSGTLSHGAPSAYHASLPDEMGEDADAAGSRSAHVADVYVFAPFPADALGAAEDFASAPVSDKSNDTKLGALSSPGGGSPSAPASPVSLQHRADSRAGLGSPIAPLLHASETPPATIDVPGGHAYVVLVVVDATHLMWEARYIHSLLTSLVPFHPRHVVGTPVQCWTSKVAVSNQVFSIRSVREGKAVTLSPRCCKDALFVGMKPGQNELCLVDSPFEWRMEAVQHPYMSRLFRMGLEDRSGLRFVQADIADNGRPLSLAMAGFVDSRQLVRATFIDGPAAPLFLPPPSSARPVLPDGAYAVTSLKHGPSLAWDATHNTGDHSGAAGPTATGVYLYPSRSEPQQRFVVKSIAGGSGDCFSFSPLCCLGRLYLGIRGSSVCLVPHPYAWRLEHADGKVGQFRLSNDYGQRIEVPWSMISASHTRLSLGAPSNSRRQVFEFKAI